MGFIPYTQYIQRDSDILHDVDYSSDVHRSSELIYLFHSSVVKRTLGKSHDFDCAFDYDLIGQIYLTFAVIVI